MEKHTRFLFSRVFFRRTGSTSADKAIGRGVFVGQRMARIFKGSFSRLLEKLRTQSRLSVI